VFVDELAAVGRDGHEGEDDDPPGRERIDVE
jgi:hypothetical protein